MVRCEMKYDSSFVLYNLGFFASSNTHHIEREWVMREWGKGKLVHEEYEVKVCSRFMLDYVLKRDKGKNEIYVFNN